MSSAERVWMEPEGGLAGGPCIGCSRGCMWEIDDDDPPTPALCPRCLDRARRRELRREAKNFGRAAERVQAVIESVGCELTPAALSELQRVVVELHNSAVLLREHADQRK